MPAAHIEGTTEVTDYIGSSGNDNFGGTAGADTFSGGAGDEIYRVNNVDDRVIERVGDGTDIVVTTIDYTLGPVVT